MFMDPNLTFCYHDQVAADLTVGTHVVPGAAATFAGVIDTVRIPRSIYNQLFLVLRLGVPLQGAGASIDFQMIASATNPITNPVVVQDLAGIIPNATMIAYPANSFIFIGRLAILTIPLEFLTFQWIISGGNLSAGTWDLFLTPDVQILPAYQP